MQPARRAPRLPTWLMALLAAVVLVGAPSGIVWTAYFASIEVTRPAPEAVASDPLELDIESLGLRDVGILPMAMADGVLHPPDNPRLVGWWRDSADAGAETGTTLLTSHKVANGNGVFEHLVEVEPGAGIVVVGEGGGHRYVVDEVRVLHKDELALEAPQLFAQDGPHRLVLVTCEDWDGTDFQSNSVVVASPQPDPVADGT